MTENLKKFLEEVSKDEELTRKVNNESDKAALIAMARDMGIALTESDFEERNELSDDELDAIVGGGKCTCVMGGGGKDSTYDKTCACVVVGGGYSRNGYERCACGFYGSGKAC